MARKPIRWRKEEDRARKKSGKKEVLTDSVLKADSRFDITESYKTARTNIIYSLVDDNSKTVCVSSPSPSEGKTTTCINLAITFAQTGAKVLLIDGDLRKPLIHRYLKLQAKPGLTNVLGGFSLLEDSIQKTTHDNLDVLVCGHIPPNPVEILASKNMQGVLETLKTQYDYIFIDSPPVNTVTDVAVLSEVVSGIVLVIRQGVTLFDDVAEAIEKLKLVNAKILGFVLNEVNESSKYYNRKKSYKKYYKKYDSYSH